MASGIEVLDRRGAEKAGHGTKPEDGHRGRPTLAARRADLVAEKVGHVRAEASAEVQWQHPEESSKNLLRARDAGLPPHVAHSRMIVRTAGDFTSA